VSASAGARRIPLGGLLRVVAVLLLGGPPATWLAAPAAVAQDLEPRAYTNTPIGLNFLVAGYIYQEGDVATDSSLPLDDAKVHVHATLLAYARSFALLGKSAKVDVILPYAWASGSATFQGEPHDRKINGLGDPRLRLSVNFYGAPALSLEDYASYQQDLILGASFQVTAPLGQYDSEKLLNIGSNRWAFKPELGISKAFGPLILELAPSVVFYTDNDDFLGGKTREQDPLYAVQAHVIYRFGAPLWGSVDGTYYGGGQTTIDGVENDNRQSNSRVGATLALSVSRRHSIKLYGSKGTSTRVGGDFTTVGLALQYRWGGGL
jgi:hypothetical protein